ncbi:MAG: adenosylcobinamide-GDP ribazoletransferase [Gordonia sp. (in: high G+C Gram-positive bacteria)]|uniref:adenosylcobinamide-GDP ribazoletransferase n=1 Tax=Gordonia sp. (in: high G+C Gram-positive bacteria) TaxID=84139 RepID=UPI0039E61AEA
MTRQDDDAVVPAGPRTGALHLAASWLTVLPVRQPRSAPDRRDGARVIAAVPVLGLGFGIVVAALLAGLARTDLPTPVSGTLAVVFLASITRGMHLDGLADTADGLGCYGDPERVRTVMRSGDVGPFGAATLVLVLLLQALSFAALAGDHRWYALAFAVFLGRVAVVLACRTGLSAGNPDGFGALVAGTQRASIVLWLLVATALAAAAGRLDVPGSGPATFSSSFTVLPVVRALIATALVVAFALLFTRHCARRTGGISGDVLGATLELSTVLALLVLLL